MSKAEELIKLRDSVISTVNKRIEQYNEASNVVDYTKELAGNFVARANSALQNISRNQDVIPKLIQEAKRIKRALEPRKFEAGITRRERLSAIRNQPAKLGIEANWRYTDIMDQTAKGSRDSIRENMDSEEVFQAAEILVDEGITRMWTRRDMEEALERHRTKKKPEDVFGNQKWVKKPKLSDDNEG